MIEIFTGIPGSGKSLSMVKTLSELQSKWNKNPTLARSVFVHGIPDLVLPHSVMPLKQFQSKSTNPISWVPDWDAMPDGSLVLIDEAQHLFPPRSSVSQPPPHVEWLNTHRKHGFDIWITTQQPRYIDHAVRGLVGKHQHFRRLFGTQRSIVYEWDACCDNLAATKTATKSYFKYPKNIFQLYKSAEIHTKQKFKVPIWLFLPFVALALAVFTIPKTYAVLTHGSSGQGLKTDKSVSDSKSLPGVLPAVSVVPVSGVVAPLGATTSAQSGTIPLPSDLHLISACLATVTRCQCYNHDGIHLPMSAEDCREAAHAPTDKFRLQDVASRS